jgi:hypothetical protein
MSFSEIIFYSAVAVYVVVTIWSAAMDWRAPDNSLVRIPHDQR